MTKNYGSGLILAIFAGLLLTIPLQSLAQQSTEDAEPLLDLIDGSFKQKAKSAEQLAESSNPRMLVLLQTWLEGDLYFLESTKQLVSVQKSDGGYVATDILSEQSVGEFSSKEIEKVRTNNTLRTRLRDLIAVKQIANPNDTARLQAVQQLLGEADDDLAERIKGLMSGEQNKKIAATMQTVVDLEQIVREPSANSALFARLSKRLEPEVRNTLGQLANSDDLAIKKMAGKAVQRIDERIGLFDKFKTLFFGLSLGSVLVLAAVGLAITFGVMGVINMAHGELIMLGAYTTWVLQQLMPNSIGTALVLSIPAAFIVSALTGMLIERTVIRHLYGRPLETLLATFGISLILQQAVRSVFSPLNRSVVAPEWLSGSWEINSALTLTLNRLYIIGFCLVVFAILFLVMKKTRLGLQVRAVSQNRLMARAMGVRASKVDMLTFGLGSGIAGIAGVALSQLTNVGPNLGQAYIIDSFMVVVFGGVGNLWGTLVSGFSLGVANKILEPWSGAVLSKILVLIFIILFIQRRPRGLFPQKGRAVES